MFSKKNYQIDWVFDQLAVGGAPMSYEDLDVIKNSGIDAILNLCAEFCDLHEIEGKYDFEVYYLPVNDEDVPDEKELNKAMDWIDDIISRGKKVLIHCRLGIGRTGTVLYAYLTSRGLSKKLKDKSIKKLRCRPDNYYQWKLVHKYRNIDALHTHQSTYNAADKVNQQ